MDNWHKVGSVTIVVLLALLLLSNCNRVICPELVIDGKDTVSHTIVYDTNWTDSTIYRYFSMPVPVPYYDTTDIFDTIPIPMFVDEGFDDWGSMLLTYEDSVRDDTVTLKYKIRVRGILEQVSLAYKLHTPYMIIRTELIETEVTKKIKHKLGWYIGLDVGGNKDQFGHVAPMLELSTWRYNYNAGYNVIDGSIIIGIRARIGKKIKLL